MAKFLCNPEISVKIGEPVLKMKKYLVVLIPKKDIPANGSWNVAIARIRLYVIAENTKSARELAVSAMELHDLYCKVAYIRELKGE